MSKGCPCLVCHESYLVISTGMKDPSLQPVIDIIPHVPLCRGGPVLTMTHWTYTTIMKCCQQ
jgi:hypothetical protein